MFTLKFFLNQRFKLASGKSAIYARVILGREKFEFSTKQTIGKDDVWNTDAQKVTGNTKINLALYNISQEVAQAYEYLKRHNLFLTASELRKHLNRKENLSLQLLAFYEKYYIENLYPRAEVSLAKKRLFKLVLGRLKGFLKQKGMQDVLLADINQDIVREFQFYLMNSGVKGGIRRNSANTYLKCLKFILSKAESKKFLNENPFAEYKFRFDQARVTYLNSKELNDLINYELNKSHLLLARDIFLFSVYTGIRYSDIFLIKSANIEFQGKSLWLAFSQKKTGFFNRIPMLDKAVEIYSKYKLNLINNDYLFSKIPNQTLNRRLNKIAGLVGIKKKLTHNVARHTAATTIFLQNGVSLEITSSLLGHQNIKTTQIYAKISDSMVKKSITKLNRLI